MSDMQQWVEVKNEKTGGVYYFNKITGITSQDKPGTRPQGSLGTQKSLPHTPQINQMSGGNAPSSSYQSLPA